MNTTDSRTPKTEIFSRINKLQHCLQKDRIDGALIVQKADLFYFAGTIQDAHLYVPADGRPLLLVHKDQSRAQAESAIQMIEPLKGLRQISERIHHHCKPAPQRIGLEFDVLPVNHYLNFKRFFEKVDWIDISDTIRRIRTVKSTYEIECIKEAARLSDRLAAGLPDLLQENMTEIELAGQVEALARKLGHQGIVRMRLWGHELFYGHLMAGPAAAVGSYLASPTGGVGVGPAVAQGAGQRTILRHEPILLDYVFVYRGYISDHTRIFSLGDLSDDLMQAHEAMRSVQATVKKAAKPGAVAGDLYSLAIETAKELGYGDHFMGYNENRVRFVGHGVGIELDEYPFLAQGQDTVLEKGMAIAFEPKLIFPEKGVVGVENTHIVEADGLQQLGQYSDAITIV